MTHYVITKDNKKQVINAVAQAILVNENPVYIMDFSLVPYEVTSIGKTKATSCGYAFKCRKPGSSRNSCSWLLEAGDHVVIGYKWSTEEEMAKKMNEVKATELAKKLASGHWIMK